MLLTSLNYGFLHYDHIMILIRIFVRYIYSLLNTFLTSTPVTTFLGTASDSLTVSVLRWGDQEGHTPRSLLCPLLTPHFSRRVQNFEFRIYCLLKIRANEKDVQGMNMILLDCYCTLTYTKWCSRFLCAFWFCM